MFNKAYISLNNTEYVPYTKNVEIKEIKAPTDESIKLFKELQQKAINDIVSVLRLEDNVIHGAVIETIKKPYDNKTLRRIAFKLNGKPIVIDVEMENSMFDKPEDISKKFAEIFSQKLLSEVSRLIIGR